MAELRLELAQSHLEPILNCFPTCLLTKSWVLLLLQETEEMMRKELKECNSKQPNVYQPPWFNSGPFCVLCPCLSPPFELGGSQPETLSLHIQQPWPLDAQVHGPTRVVNSSSCIEIFVLPFPELSPTSRKQHKKQRQAR
jgi:hypothetical protein